LRLSRRQFDLINWSFYLLLYLQSSCNQPNYLYSDEPHCNVLYYSPAKYVLTAMENALEYQDLIV